MSRSFACPHCGRTPTFWPPAGSAPCEHCGGNLRPRTAEGRTCDALPRAGQPQVAYARQIVRHIRRTIGESTMVFHQRLPNGMPLDIHVVPPQGRARSEDHPFGRDYFTLVTSGMSALRTMPGSSAGTYAELMISLPVGWPGLRPDGTLDPAAMEIEANRWPLDSLKASARMPDDGRENIAQGEALRNEMRVRATASATLPQLMMGPSRLHPRSASLMVHDDIAIEFHALWALHRKEAEFRFKHGAEALWAEFERENVTELVDMRRVTAIKHAVQGV